MSPTASCGSGTEKSTAWKSGKTSRSKSAPSRASRNRSTAIFGFSARNRKPPPLDRRQSLAGVPVLNLDVSVARDEKDHTVVRVRLKRGAGLLARFQPRVTERTVRLDELGTFVFRQIDGRKSTLQIIEAFIARYRVNRREAELSTVEFLKSLARRGAISIVIK